MAKKKYCLGHKKEKLLFLEMQGREKFSPGPQIHFFNQFLIF